MRLSLGICLLAGAVWTGAALGGVFVGDAPTVAPANDNFANPIVLAGSNVTRAGDTNVDATLETGEPDTVAGRTAENSVWYTLDGAGERSGCDRPGDERLRHAACGLHRERRERSGRGCE